MDEKTADEVIDRIFAARMALARAELDEWTQVLASVIGGLKSDLATVATAPNAQGALLSIAHRLEARAAGLEEGQ
ncbi:MULTISPECIES: hypothetical protein [Halorhodospira]|uniref:hypothetical protein n=1 Tax=Halorhodospira TaxID=85108 RepID=UPI001913690B|nr:MULTISPECIES: hypothetical protein [Halorhodospira]MBK5943350.1 hypothetical protein [Halorhodospira halophila]MCG5526875.1 hypothetical protein [Halorhodospira halophila]MCG5542788.1 hypothetical protein [Halorhodospira sp. 9628]